MQTKPVLKIDDYGNRRWYMNDKLHRTDGPAIEWADGEKEWFLNGKRHRTDGPAIEYSDGVKEWWLNDVWHTFEIWLKLTPISDQEKIKLRLKYAK